MASTRAAESQLQRAKSKSDTEIGKVESQSSQSNVQRVKEIMRHPTFLSRVTKLGRRNSMARYKRVDVDDDVVESDTDASVRRAGWDDDSHRPQSPARVIYPTPERTLSQAGFTKTGTHVRMSDVSGYAGENHRYDKGAKSAPFSMMMVAEELGRKQMLKNLVEEIHKVSKERRALRTAPGGWWMLHPTSPRRRYWDLFIALNLVYTMLFLPVRICFNITAFDDYNYGWWVESVVNMVFLVDLFMNLSTGVYVKVILPMGVPGVSPGSPSEVDMDEDGEESSAGFSNFRESVKLSFRFRDILTSYAKGWLWIDAVSVVPWEILLQASFASSSSMDVASAPRLLKLFRLARLLKLLRVLRLRKIQAHIEKIIPSTLLQLTKMAVTVSLLAHYVACGFYFIAVMTDENGTDTWLSRYTEDVRPIPEFHMGSLYLTSIYWAFSTITTVGYGDVVPVTHAEKSYALCVMYAGVATMSAITGKLTTILSQFGAQDALVRQQMDSVNTYCKYRNLPAQLRESVTAFFEVRAAQRAICNEQDILEEMSPSLKARVVCYIFRSVIEAVPFFRGCSDLFLSAVLVSMEAQLYAPADVVIQKGTREACMFILVKGRAGVMNKFGRLIHILHEGSFFGEIGLFFGTRRTVSICSITFCDMFKLSQSKFLQVQEMYPEMRQRIHVQAEEMFNVHCKCYLCGQTGHISVQCRNPEPAKKLHHDNFNGLTEIGDMYGDKEFDPYVSMSRLVPEGSPKRGPSESTSVLSRAVSRILPDSLVKAIARSSSRVNSRVDQSTSAASTVEIPTSVPKSLPNKFSTVEASPLTSSSPSPSSPQIAPGRDSPELLVPYARARSDHTTQHFARFTSLPNSIDASEGNNQGPAPPPTMLPTNELSQRR